MERRYEGGQLEVQFGLPEQWRHPSLACMQTLSSLMYVYIAYCRELLLTVSYLSQIQESYHQHLKGPVKVHAKQKDLLSVLDWCHSQNRSLSSVVASLAGIGHEYSVSRMTVKELD